VRKVLLLTLTLLCVASLAWAQDTGSVSGTVTDSLNNPVAQATVELGRGMHNRLHTQTGPDGTFLFPEVEAGHYVAMASKMGMGRDIDSVDVVAGQNSVVNFVLQGGAPPPPPDDETGSVSGTVRDTLNNPVAGAMINLMAPPDRHRPHGPRHNYHAESAADGTFEILNVVVGHYMAMAAKMGVGHDADSVTVVADQNSVVDFVLSACGRRDDGGGHRGDSLRIVTVSGWAVVVMDSLRAHYFLDANGDDTVDFRLAFGPPWYEPDNGAHRPNDGDSIWVTGGLMGYGNPQALVVYEINGLFWRQPGRGHGGHGGHGGGYPHPDSLELIETSGLVIIHESHLMDRYLLDVNYDDTADYVLNFGPPDYNPDNGATRPEEGDTVTIVGGLMDGHRSDLDMIIVYEIDGQEWWRDPGDTTLLWLSVLSVDDSDATQLPESYVTASSYPNPFNAQAFISFELKQTEHVKITVYDILGQQVAVLADQVYPAGKSEVLFDMNKVGSGSAVYFYRVDAGRNAATGKMVLLK